MDCPITFYKYKLLRKGRVGVNACVWTCVQSACVSAPEGRSVYAMVGWTVPSCHIAAVVALMYEHTLVRIKHLLPHTQALVIVRLTVHFCLLFFKLSWHLCTVCHPSNPDSSALWINTWMLSSLHHGFVAFEVPRHFTVVLLCAVNTH